jgi:hypothetical protein
MWPSILIRFTPVPDELLVGDYFPMKQELLGLGVSSWRNMGFRVVAGLSAAESFHVYFKREAGWGEAARHE